MKRACAAFVLLCAVLGVLSACTGGTLQSGQARLAVERARVEVRRPGEPTRVVTDDLTLHAGDRVKVLAGEARMRLPKGNQLWLRKGSDVTVGVAPRVNSGDVVATARTDRLTVRAADAEAHVTGGAARVRRDLGMSAGTYAGSVRLTSAGRSIAVPALRQVAVATLGRLPARPSPLSFSDSDLWDRQFLGLAMELTSDLQRRSEGFTAHLDPGEGRSAGFYRLLLPDLDHHGFDAALVDRTRAPGETLVGAAIAVRGDRGRLDQRWREIFAFRDDGAAWGLVALDQAVTDVPGIRRVLTEAIGRLPVPAASGVVAAPALGAVVPDGTVSSSPGAVAATGSVPPTVAPPVRQPVPTPQPPSPPTPVTPPPVTTLPPPDGPVDAVLDPVVDTVDDLVSGLLG